VTRSSSESNAEVRLLLPSSEDLKCVIELEADVMVVDVTHLEFYVIYVKFGGARAEVLIYHAQSKIVAEAISQTRQTLPPKYKVGVRAAATHVKKAHNTSPSGAYKGRPAGI